MDKDDGHSSRISPLRPGQGQFLFHIDERTRIAVRRWLASILQSLRELPNPRWLTSTKEGIELSVPRAARIKGCRRMAKLTIVRDDLRVVVNPPACDILPFDIGGDGPEPAGDADPTAYALRTLGFWLDGLAEPHCEEHDVAAARFRAAVRTLLRGAAARSGLSWRNMDAMPLINGDHCIRLWADGHDGFVRFGPHHAETGPRISKALSLELDRLASEWVHVSKLICGHPDELPVMLIGPTDHIWFSSEGDGPLDILRAVAATSDGVELHWPRDLTAAG